MKRIYVISARDEEIAFTSGRTEADSFALASEFKGNHITKSERKDSRHE